MDDSGLKLGFAFRYETVDPKIDGAVKYITARKSWSAGTLIVRKLEPTQSYAQNRVKVGLIDCLLYIKSTMKAPFTFHFDV